MKMYSSACAIMVATVIGAVADEVKKVPVTFAEGRDTVVLSGEVKGDDSVVYVLPAKDGQFLTVNLRPNSRFANFNVYIPGKSLGDEALYASDLGGKLEYLGQLYKNGEHQVAVFLNRAAARRGEEAKFDVAFRLTPNNPGSATIAVDQQEQLVNNDGNGVPTKAILLQRQAKLPESIQNSPEAIVHAVLAPSAIGQMHEAKSHYDSVEAASEVKVVVQEGGILDDDLLGITHTVSLLKNTNGEWRIVDYQRVEKRR